MKCVHSFQIYITRAKNHMSNYIVCSPAFESNWLLNETSDHESYRNLKLCLNGGTSLFIYTVLSKPRV